LFTNAGDIGKSNYFSRFRGFCLFIIETAAGNDLYTYILEVWLAAIELIDPISNLLSAEYSVIILYLLSFYYLNESGLKTDTSFSLTKKS
jgi:hypothetical protein